MRRPSRFYLRNWWWVVLAGCHSGLRWQQVILGQTQRDQEGRVTSWSQRTEVLKTSSEQERQRFWSVSSFEAHSSLLYNFYRSKSHTCFTTYDFNFSFIRVIKWLFLLSKVTWGSGGLSVKETSMLFNETGRMNFG